MDIYKTEGRNIFSNFSFQDPSFVLIEENGKINVLIELERKKIELNARNEGKELTENKDKAEVYLCNNPISAMLCYKCSTTLDYDSYYLITRNEELKKDTAFLHSYEYALSPEDGLIYIKYHILSKKDAIFIIDIESLKEDEIKEIIIEGRKKSRIHFLLIDKKEKINQYKSYKPVVLTEESIKKDELACQSFLSFTLRNTDVKTLDKQFLNSLVYEGFDNTVTKDDIEILVNSIDDPKNYIFENYRTQDTILTLACLNSANDEVIKFLVKKGFKLQTKKRRYDFFWGLERLSYELYDDIKLTRIFTCLMKNGYKATISELFSFMKTFIDYSTHFDHILGPDYISTHDTFSDETVEELDQVRVKQFDEMSPYLPEELFTYRDSDGSTLLFFAAQHLGTYRCLEGLFKKILDRTPDINFIDEEGNNALSLATDGSFRIMLTERGAKIPKIREEKIEKAIPKLETREDHKLFSLLDSYDITEDVDKILKLLKERNDRLTKDAISTYGMTAFSLSMHNEKPLSSLYSALLFSGYDINQRGENRETALFEAVRTPEFTKEKLTWLLDNGADITLLNANGDSIANIAARLFHITYDIWTLLINRIEKKEVFMNRNNDGKTPIMIAFDYMNMYAIRALMRNKFVLKEDMEYIKTKAAEINAQTTKRELMKLFNELD